LRSFDFLPASPLVDGGLCNNLPIAPLMKDHKTPIFAVFPVEKAQQAPIRSLYSYFMAAIFSPMEHNVAEAKALIAEEFHIPIDVSFSTFDFDKALEFIADSGKYAEIYDKTCQRLNNLINLYGNVFDTTQIRFTDTIITSEYMDTLRNITRNYELGFKPRKGIVIVSVNCAQRLSHRVDERPFDSVLVKNEFEVLGKDFLYYRTDRTLFEDKKIPQIWWARNVTQNIAVPIRALALDPMAPTDKAHCLIEFRPGNNFKTGDVIELNCAYNLKHAMEKLNMGQADYFSLSNPHSKSFDDIEMILRYPRNIGDFKLQVKNSDESSPIRAASNWNYFNPQELDLNFNAIAVKAKNLGGGMTAHVDILPLPGVN
jgi:hypothetical protein